MRTNIDIDDALMQQALAAGPFKTKREVVEAGLRLLARQAHYREVLKWRGKLPWEGGMCRAGIPGRAVVCPPPRGLSCRRPTPCRYRHPAPGRVVLVADSSVWIDFLSGTRSSAAHQLARLLQAGEWRIDRDYALLHNDGDFLAFEALRGLKGWSAHAAPTNESWSSP